ncbi:MAG: hypothetical protein ACJ71F_11595 [Nitrososphaeraceae archaeon]
MENMIIEPHNIENLQGITFHHSRSLKGLSSKCSVANNSQMLSAQIRIAVSKGGNNNK